MNNINEKKTRMRREMVKLRDSLLPMDFKNKNKRIQDLFFSLELSNKGQNFMSYVNIGKEVETRKIIKQLLIDGKNLSVPLCIRKTTELLASQIFDLEELELSSLKLMEPKRNLVRPIDPMNLEIILVPGLAFDRDGNRLGYGKGYYDRFFTHLNPNALKIGLAYSFQIIDMVPTDHHDVPLDIIITEKELIYFKNSRC